MQAIRSHEGAYTLAQQLMSGMETGETLEVNAITLTKLDTHSVAVNHSEYNYSSGQNVEATMYSVELADFVLYPERKRVNDALGAIEQQLNH